MRRPIVLAIVALLVFSAFTQVLSQVSQGGSSRTIDLGFVAPEICPEPVDTGVLLGGGNSLVATSAGKKPKVLLKANRAARSNAIGSAAYITGEEQSAMLTIGKPWIAATACRSAAIDAWFVGGSGQVESQSTLVLINQAATDASAEITAWTPNGPAASSTLSVPALGTAQISLDRFAAASLVTRVRALSGRLGAYLLDRRSRGLTILGGDYVAAQPAPDRRLVFVGMPAKTPNRLRLLVPGTQDAVVRVDVAFGSDRFTPDGFDSLRVKAGSVVELALNVPNSAGYGAVVVDSDVPILAGIYTPMVDKQKQLDFAWLAPSRPLTSPAIALAAPGSSLLVFNGDFFSASRPALISSSDLAGKVQPQVEIDQIKSMALTASLRFEPNKNLYLAQILSSKSGLSILPINPMERTQKRVAPVHDLRVLTPR